MKKKTEYLCELIFKISVPLLNAIIDIFWQMFFNSTSFPRNQLLFENGLAKSHIGFEIVLEKHQLQILVRSFFEQIKFLKPGLP